MTTLLTLHSPAQTRAYYASDVWQDDTLYSRLALHARARPQAYALRDGTHRITWLQLLQRVDHAAGVLHQAGLRRGERVSVWLPNRVEGVATLLACSRNGYICNPSLHQNYTVAEIIELLSQIRASALVAQSGYGANSKRADIFAEAAKTLSLKLLLNVDDLASDERRANVVLPAPNRDPDKIVYLAFTSGTTGKPKGVMHTDNTLLANGRAMVRDWAHDEQTILLSLSPMSHHIGTVALEQALVAGCELVMNAPPAGMSALDWILHTGANYVMGVPTHAIDLQAQMAQRDLNRLGAVKIFYMAGAAIPAETAQRFLDMDVTPLNCYGMTENGSHQYTLPTDTAETIVQTCGRACHGYEVRLFRQDNPDEEAAPGEVGEIGGRGGVLALGYFDNQAATEGSFNRDGWFMSGDLGQFDAQGCLRIIGRKKDLIIRGGHNIYPARIEDLAHRHPSVQKAAAFPVADTRLGEKVCLAIIACGNIELAVDDLLSHLADSGLSKYDMPEYFIQLEAFPLTASGKVLKRELVQWASSGQIEPRAVRWVDPEKAA